MAESAYNQGVGVIGVVWPWSTTGPQAASGLELIESKMKFALFTQKGTHKMEPTFGSNLIALVFENRGSVLAKIAEIEIRNTLSTWVPEVRVLVVNVVDDRNVVEGLVTIEVEYLYLGQQNTLTSVLDPSLAGSGV